jgi:Zn ribbon nucleic-acid-binding protein
MSDEEGAEPQARLQNWTDVDAPPVEDAPATCVRCGEELGDDRDFPTGAGPAERQSGFVDVRKFDDEPDLCDDCKNLKRYLHHRYSELTDKRNVSGAVAVYCGCQTADEVDVRPVYHGDRPTDVECAKCGSNEVVIEELPPTGATWRVEQ